jgi:hypothetical protein
MSREVWVTFDSGKQLRIESGAMSNQPAQVIGVHRRPSAVKLLFS